MAPSPPSPVTNTGLQKRRGIRRNECQFFASLSELTFQRYRSHTEPCLRDSARLQAESTVHHPAPLRSPLRPSPAHAAPSRSSPGTHRPAPPRAGGSGAELRGPAGLEGDSPARSPGLALPRPAASPPASRPAAPGAVPAAPQAAMMAARGPRATPSPGTQRRAPSVPRSGPGRGSPARRPSSALCPQRGLPSRVWQRGSDAACPLQPGLPLPDSSPPAPRAQLIPTPPPPCSGLRIARSSRPRGQSHKRTAPALPSPHPCPQQRPFCNRCTNIHLQTVISTPRLMPPRLFGWGDAGSARGIPRSAGRQATPGLGRVSLSHHTSSPQSKRSLSGCTTS